MIKQLKFVPLCLIAVLAGCSTSSSEISSISSSEESSSISSQEPSLNFDEITYNQDLLWMPDIKIEVEQKEYLKCYLLENENSKIWIGDKSKLSFENDYLIGLAEGETFIVYEANGEYKKVNVSIAAKGTYKRAYTFDSIANELKGKFVCNFGDSLTFDCTVGDFVSVYPRRFASKYKMHSMGEKYQEDYYLESIGESPKVTEDYNVPSTYCTNYAVGGSTSLYPPKNSLLWKSYKDTRGFGNFYDGCDRCQILLQDGSLAKMDVMFLSYGYNDLAFQPEIDAVGDDVECHDTTFACCNSFKGCWRYMINCARAANPNMKIILMNMIYNEHSWQGHEGYKGITFQDFRKAVFELGYEMDVKVIDPWNHMKQYFDWVPGRVEGNMDPTTAKSFNYRDEWHPSIMGHKYLANFVAKH